MNTIYKPDFIKMIHEKINHTPGLSHVNYHDVRVTINTMLKVLEDILEQGDEVKLIHYFSLKPRFYPGRVVKQTWRDKEVTSPVHYRPKFKPFTKLEKACERYTEHLEYEEQEREKWKWLEEEEGGEEDES